MPVPIRAPLPASGSIDGGAGPLRFEVVGTGPDTVIIPLGTWLRDSLAALGEGHVVVFYDPRHRGASVELRDSTAATFDGDVADLEAIRTGLRLTRVAVLGYDYYAAVVAAWAAAHPDHVSRVVLLSPIEPADSLARAFDPPARRARIDTVAARALVKARAAGRDTSDLAGYCEQFWAVNAPLFLSDTALAGSWRAPWCTHPNESPGRVAAATAPVLDSLGPDVDFAARATGLRVPVLVIHGREDLVASPEGAHEWARRLPDARLLRLRDTGHLPFVEAAATLRRAVDFFLMGHWPPLSERVER
jgi:proline iminopeptidase